MSHRTPMSLRLKILSSFVVYRKNSRWRVCFFKLFSLHDDVVDSMQFCEISFLTVKQNGTRVSNLHGTIFQNIWTYLNPYGYYVSFSIQAATRSDQLDFLLVSVKKIDIDASARKNVLIRYWNVSGRHFDRHFLLNFFEHYVFVSKTIKVHEDLQLSQPTDESKRVSRIKFEHRSFVERLPGAKRSWTVRKYTDKSKSILLSVTMGATSQACYRTEVTSYPEKSYSSLIWSIQASSRLEFCVTFGPNILKIPIDWRQSHPRYIE